MLFLITLLIGVFLYAIGLGALIVSSNVSPASGILARVFYLLVFLSSLPLLCCGVYFLYYTWRALEHGALHEPELNLSLGSVAAISVLLGGPLYRFYRTVRLRWTLIVPQKESPPRPM